MRPEEGGRGFIDDNNMRGVVEYSIVTPVSAHGRWLAAQLARQFDHVCVESADELDDHRVAVTMNGTVKLPGNHYRGEASGLGSRSVRVGSGDARHRRTRGQAQHASG
jgi:uncharacterized protein YPO0396